VRILVLGGGFGGVATARHLERRLRGQRDIEITLVSRENFFVLTPLLFESCSGRLELRHCAQPIRAALRRTRFIEANVDHVDVERQTVRAVSAEGTGYDLPYDQLVVALGGATNDCLIPGSSNAFTFKTMADALVLRNHVIEQFERADATAEASTRRGCLTIVVIGLRYADAFNDGGLFASRFFAGCVSYDAVFEGEHRRAVHVRPLVVRRCCVEWPLLLYCRERPADERCTANSLNVNG